MKVAHILNKIEFSGAEIMLYQAAGVFASHNIETTLVASGNGPGKFEDSMRNVGYQIAQLGPNDEIDYFKQLYKYFKANKFDVVHIHTEKLYLWKVIILRLTGHNNIVRTFHNCWTFKGMLLFKRRLHRRIASWLGVKKQSIGPSAFKNEKEHFWNKTVIINNWVETHPELLPRKNELVSKKKRELGIAESSYVVVSVGGCSPVKNHNYIIDLVKTLIDEGLDITYLHVGTGTDEDAEKEKVKSLGIASRVIFTGARTDVPELLMSSDVYVMPSLFEGLSNARVEAMYYTGVVILNDVPGLTDMMIKDENGFIIDIKDRQAYIDLLKDLYYKKIDVSEMKVAAKKCVEENFGVEKNVNQLVELYKQGTRLN